MDSISKSNSNNDRDRVYFDYDEVFYYKNSIDENKITQLLETNKKQSEIDPITTAIILGGAPKSISDSSILAKLESINYVRKELDSSRFEELNQIFTQKERVEGVATACIPVYRDILVFKKRSDIVGVAKICFSCRKNLIIGTKANTENFGGGDEYERLEKLLSY